MRQQKASIKSPIEVCKTRLHRLPEGDIQIKTLRRRSAIRAERPQDDDYEPTDDIGGRTFLGGTSLGIRSWLYFLSCAAAAVAFAALFIHVDSNLNAAFQKLETAQRMDELANAAERGTYSLQARQQNFSLTRNAEAAEGFSADIAGVSEALDELFSFPEAQPLAQHVTTVRDGLVQYDQQFQAFVAAERQIGLADNSGLSAELKGTSAALRAAFRETGNANLVNQVDRIDQQGEETALSGSTKGIEEIRNRYDTLGEFAAAADIGNAMRARINELLRTHETQMLAIINGRLALTGEAKRFGDLVDYFIPSLTAIGGFTDRNRLEASAQMRNAQLLARYTTIGGAAAILIWLLFFGLLLLKSVTTPAEKIARALERVARGASHITVPAQGNKDAFGRIARMVDRWADTIIEADQLRGDLDRTRDQLERANEQIGNAEAAAADARERADLAEEEARLAKARAEYAPKSAPVAPPPPEPEPEPEIIEDSVYEEPATRPQRRPSAVDAYRQASEPELGGPISSISQRLQSFSEYVSAAANDVERTEALIRGIDTMGGLVDEIGELVLAIRDQTNLLAFRGPGKDAMRGADDDGNLIPFNADGRSPDAERAYAKRFDLLRDATERTERTAYRIKETLEEVSEIAREIAQTASHQALDATNRLLSQSEYLQNMLDDIMSKVQPARPGALSERRPPKRIADDDPFA